MDCGGRGVTGGLPLGTIQGYNLIRESLAETLPPIYSFFKYGPYGAFELCVCVWIFVHGRLIVKCPWPLEATTGA